MLVRLVQLMLFSLENHKLTVKSEEALYFLQMTFLRSRCPIGFKLVREEFA
jgi:hypothetical protein